MKNYANNFDAVWYGNIWHILANIIAQEIPPKNPIALELNPLFLAQTLIILRVCLKFYCWLTPASSKIIRLFFRPKIDVLLAWSFILLIKSILITRYISLGIVYSSSLQKLISMFIYLKSKVIIGTLADFLTDNPFTSG